MKIFPCNLSPLGKLFLLCALLIFPMAQSLAQGGILDTSFSHDGMLMHDYDNNEDRSQAITVQPDGKILVAGSTTFFGSNFLITRFLTDGTVDSTFGINGTTEQEFGKRDIAYTMGLQSNGKIVLAGQTAFNTAISRLFPTGKADTTFGNNGKIILTYPHESNVYSVKTEKDGNYLFAGSGDSIGEFMYSLIRMDSTGKLDSTFGNNGRLLIGFPGYAAVAYTVLVQPDDKIVLVGTLYGSDMMLCLVRLNKNGSYDYGFGNYGIYTSSWCPWWEEWKSAALQPDGKIVVGGYVTANSSMDTMMAVARYNSDGTVDKNFGNQGIVTSFVDNRHSKTTSVVLQPDGRIVSCATVGNTGYALMRLDKNGVPDNTFGAAGILRGDTTLQFLALQADGKILAAGRGYKTNNLNLLVARFLPGPALGVLSFKPGQNPVFIYPNPLGAGATFTYTLAKEDFISIYVTDELGRIVKNFKTEEKQQQGDHEQYITLPESTAAGVYFLVLASPSSRQTIKLVK